MQQFQKSKVDFVVIEKNEKHAQDLIKDGVLTVIGDATREEILE